MADWVRRTHSRPEAWHRSARRSNDHSPGLVVTSCGLTWSADEPMQTTIGLEVDADQRCPDCRQALRGSRAPEAWVPTGYDSGRMVRAITTAGAKDRR